MKTRLQNFLILGGIGFVLGVGGVLIVNSVFTNGDQQSTPNFGNASETRRTTPNNRNQGIGQGDKQAQNNISGSSNAIENVALQQDTFLREQVIYSYVDGLTEREIEQVLERTKESSWKLSHHVRKELQIALLERLATSNPSEAVEFALAQTDVIEFEELPTARTQLGEFPFTHLPTELNRSSFVHIVFREWAQYDLESAIARAQHLQLEYKNAAVEGIVEAQSNQPLSTLLELVEELDVEEAAMSSYSELFNAEHLEDPETLWNDLVVLQTASRATHSWTLSNVALQWYEQEGLSVVEKIQASTTDNYLKGNAIYRILHAAVNDSPDLALSVALHIPNHSLGRGIFFFPAREVAGAWASRDPHAAMQSVETVENSGQRNDLKRQVAATWAWNEPHYVLANLEELPAELISIAISNAIRKIARTSPREAAELTLEKTDGSTRVGAQRTVVNEWVRLDAEASIEWILNLPESEESRDEWVEALTNYLVWLHPLRAFEIAVQQPLVEDIPDTESIGLEAQVIESIALDDIDTAIELLPQVRSGPTKSNAYAGVAVELIDKGETKRALSLGLQLPDANQATFFKSIAASWATVDAADLIESIEQLPSTEIRSALALAASTGRAKSEFSKKQLETLRQYLTEADRTTLDNQ
ncbi:MAG: hypothetical protein F4Z01_01305 [Gammaproteobacteria bacterium]|nr:hypothetical protein [Gammaproteobacteria bacterium]MYF37267.1 hypothetical protein [Gammaproteobacteria bacterium]